MCLRSPVYLSTKTEREGLEEALARTDALNRDWCEDGRRIIRAARKYLDTLPKPARKVTAVRYLVVSRSDERGPYSSAMEAHAVARNIHGSKIVTLSGEYDDPWN